MHDPDVAILHIRRPWPSRSGVQPVDGRRWEIGRAFWTVAGRTVWWPPVVTIWHHEPGGKDAGTVCKRWHRRPDGTTPDRSWRWHVRHWRVEFLPWRQPSEEKTR